MKKSNARRFYYCLFILPYKMSSTQTLEQVISRLCPVEKDRCFCDDFECPYIHAFSPFINSRTALRMCEKYANAFLIPPGKSFLSDGSCVSSTSLMHWRERDCEHFTNLYTHKLTPETLSQIVRIFSNGNPTASAVFTLAKNGFPGNHDAHVYIMMRLMTKYHENTWPSQAIEIALSMCKQYHG